ncbi:hypothetical protein L3V83_12355 [Thiotrichales bacterium 19X7-9]|nr:hypothetical protein [Thiotrichales bacterium 19X7-9]
MKSIVSNLNYLNAVTNLYVFMKDSNGKNIVVTFVADYSLSDDGEDFTWYEIQSAATSDFYTHISNLGELPKARAGLKEFIINEFLGSTRIDFPLTLNGEKLQQRKIFSDTIGTPKYKTIENAIDLSSNLSELFEFYQQSPNGIITKASGTLGIGNHFIQPNLTYNKFIETVSSIKPPFTLEHLQMAYSEEHQKNIKQRALFFYDTETGKQVIIPIHTRLLSKDNYDCHKVKPSSENYIGYLPEITQLQTPLLQKWTEQVSEKIIQHYKDSHDAIRLESHKVITEYNESIGGRKYLGKHAPKEDKCDFFHSANPGLLTTHDQFDYSTAFSNLQGEFYSNSNQPITPFVEYSIQPPKKNFISPVCLPP